MAGQSSVLWKSEQSFAHHVDFVEMEGIIESRMMKRMMRYMPEGKSDAMHMTSLIKELGQIIEKINV